MYIYIYTYIFIYILNTKLFCRFTPPPPPPPPPSKPADLFRRIFKG